MLVHQGFYEAMNLSMYKKEYNDWLNFDETTSVDIINSLSSDLAVMRRSILPGLLENVDFNIKRKNDRIKLFELGKTYQKIEGEFQETKTLGIVIAGNWNQESWNQKQEKVDILQLKGTLEQILRRLKIQDYQLDLNPTTYEDNGIDYNLQENKIAHLAKLSSTLLKKFDIDKEVYYAEIYLTPVLDNLIQSNKLQHQLISKFPSVRRDLALLLDAQITYQDIKNLVIKSNDVLVKNVNLFDVYEGDKLPEGKKSYAISIHLQDENKTMTDKQIDHYIFAEKRIKRRT
jgi:phenylalanyl-tRNA synthetase beta chain